MWAESKCLIAKVSPCTFSSEIQQSVSEVNTLLQHKRWCASHSSVSVFFTFWIRRWSSVLWKAKGQGLDIGLNVRKLNSFIWSVWIAETIETKYHHLCSCWGLRGSRWVLFSENNVLLCINSFCVYDVQKDVFGVWWLLANVWSLWLNPRSWTVCISGQRQQIYSHNGRNITVKTLKNFLTCLRVFYYPKIHKVEVYQVALAIEPIGTSLIMTSYCWIHKNLLKKKEKVL